MTILYKDFATHVSSYLITPMGFQWALSDATHWWSSMSEIVEFVMGPVLGVLGILGMIYVLLIKPAYQRMVQKKEWGEILGHAQEDANHGEDA